MKPLNFKFRVTDELHSQRIQEQLHKLGYNWKQNTPSSVKNTDASFLFAYHRNFLRITKANVSRNFMFEKHSAKEAMLLQPQQRMFLKKLTDTLDRAQAQIINEILDTGFYLEEDIKWLNFLRKRHTT